MKTEAFLDILNVGRLDFTPFAVIDGTPIYPQVLTTVSGETIHITCQYHEKLSDDFYFTCEGKNGISCRRVFQNHTGGVIHLNELGLALRGITFGGSVSDDYFYHNENPRIYQRMTFPVDYCRTAADASDSEYDISAGTRWADPGVVCERIGRSPYQPFPAIHLGNYASAHGIVHGTLSQKVFYHNYLVSHENNTVTLAIYSSFKAIEYLEAAPERVLVDEWWIGTTEHAGDLERIFEDYADVLRKKLPANYGASAINRDTMIWGSWNDGNSRRISEEMLLREARYLQENFPMVRWFQLDDGYAVDVPPAHGLGVPYEGEDGVDHIKFPEGLRHYSDKLREIGLRPALWIGGLCAHKTKIYREHPEWFCDYSIRIPDQSPLDVSLPEVREYMSHALDVLLSEYGFDAVKHDFWSYAFEDSHDLLHIKTESGYYYRDWWLKELRRRLPTDGYLQTGCDIVMGNPFLGELFTNYRYGIDIGSGNWDYVKTNFLWGAACFATHTGDLFVPNSDSVGLFPGLNDTDAMFALNYCLVTHSMVEIAGNLSLSSPENPRLRKLRKATCNVNNGQDIYFAGYDYRKGSSPLPAILYFKTPHFSTLTACPYLPSRTVGLFNTQDTPLTVCFTARELGLESGAYRILDVWTHENVSPVEETFCFTLPPHGSLLLAVLPEASILLEDTNVKVTGAAICGQTFAVDCAYAAKAAELRFSAKVKRVTMDGEELPFEERDGNCLLDIPSAGTLEFELE
ncbi:MAG: alpha-galactosidase [Clostridiaceae bacterium]|nr:alpha-galactosidase [Clostridiaceae bacterium]